MNTRYLFVFTALLATLPFLALDVTLPIFVTLQSFFHVSQGDIQQTASAYLLGMALGQVVWGALSDTMGRRSILIISLTLFTLASLMCMFVPTVKWLWAVRFIQGAGVSAPAALWQTIWVDRLESRRRDLYFAWIFPITALSPIIMPIVGAVLLEVCGFQTTYLFTAVVGLGLLITTIYMFRETLSTARRHPLSLKTYALHAIQLMSCPVFMGNMGLICLSSASFFVFIAEFPFALHQLRLSESMMGPLLIPQTIVFMVAGVLSAAMSRRFGKSRSLWYVTWLAILGSLILWAVVAFTPLTSIWQILIPYALTAFSNGAIYPLAFSAIFEAHDDKAGTAAGWVAFYMGLMGFVGAFLMGVFNEAGVVGMALLILVFYGLCLGAWALTACFIERHVAE